MEPIHKFNGGNGAMLCNECSIIISIGPKTDELWCDKCKQKNHIIEIMKSDEELKLYNEEFKLKIIANENNNRKLRQKV
jgi:hypothetical protein